MRISDVDIVKKYYHLVYVGKDNIQTSALNWTFEELKKQEAQKVLDFGCGDGRYLKTINKCNHKWFGVDLLHSPEVNRTKQAYGNRVVYDGDRLPFNNQSFDVLFSCQVLEHVQNLQTVFEELARVCKIGGKFIGSTSHLEPYHSNSLRSITPYGLERMMEEAGFRLERICSGIDCFSLICSRMFPYLLPECLSNILNKIIWSSRGSPLNRIIKLLGRIKNIDPKTLECIKLLFSGHIIFQAVRV
ncbi:MAG: class I SAM-dependent methyltransferase [Candidatus Scalindua sp.]|nr:class I SAM-dependent methyltransferase [Candidatus Scalindua sp.]MDR4503328.1 class I SAM-dependent methyltransferase [Candidatus Scalindua sp.]